MEKPKKRPTKNIIEVEEDIMNNPKYNLEKFIPGQAHLFYGREKTSGLGVVISKNPIKHLQEKRSENEFDFRSEKNLDKLVSATKSTPYVATIQNYFFTGEGNSRILYIVKEQVEGYPASALKTMYNADNIDTEDVLDFFIKLCKGVQALHDAKFLHKDLKYTNIVCDAELNPCITDLNLCRALDSSTTNVLGTKSLLPPETVPYSTAPATYDIFPLGIMLWETLDKNSGEIYNFAHECERIVEEKKINNPKEIINTVIDEMPVLVSDKVMYSIKKAIQPNPEERYQSANELEKDLSEAKKSQTSE